MRRGDALSHLLSFEAGCLCYHTAQAQRSTGPHLRQVSDVQVGLTWQLVSSVPAENCQLCFPVKLFRLQMLLLWMIKLTCCVFVCLWAEFVRDEDDCGSGWCEEGCLHSHYGKLITSVSWNRHKHCVHTVSAAKHRIGNGLNCVNQLLLLN